MKEDSKTHYGFNYGLNNAYWGFIWFVYRNWFLKTKKVPAEGFDPSALRLWDLRSNQLSYTGHSRTLIRIAVLEFKIAERKFQPVSFKPKIVATWKDSKLREEGGLSQLGKSLFINFIDYEKLENREIEHSVEIQDIIGA